MIDPKRHDRPPLRDQAIPQELRGKLEAMAGSDYAASLRALKDLIAGKMIVGSSAGHSGFMVELNDGGFLVAYLDGSVEVEARNRPALVVGFQSYGFAGLRRRIATAHSRSPLRGRIL